MPTYQYVCTECGTPLEVVQSFSDAALTDCPTCDGRLRKVFSAVGVVFKGSGFYRTDSRKEPSKGKSAEGDGKAAVAAKAKDTASGSDAKTPSAASSDSSSSSSSSSSPSSSSSGSSRDSGSSSTSSGASSNGSSKSGDSKTGAPKKTASKGSSAA